MQKKKLFSSFNFRLMFLSLNPVFLVSVFVIIITIFNSINVTNLQTRDKLESLAISVRSSYNSLNDERYAEKADGFYKGSINLSEYPSIVDTLAEEADMVASIFCKDKRIMTSIMNDDGSRAFGAKINNPDITESVLRKGEGYYVKRIELAGKTYSAYYLPLYQYDSQEVIGMIFVGILTKEVEKSLSYSTNTLYFIILFIVVFFIISGFITGLFAKGITNSIKENSRILDLLSKGDLSATIDVKFLKRADEIGDILRAVDLHKKTLSDIIVSVKHSCDDLNDASGSLALTASETETTVEQVEKAINDISEGASSQALDTNQASMDIKVIGDMIEQTRSDITDLDKNAHSMQQSGHEASSTLAELKSINEQSLHAIDIISEQTNTTNESALKIQEATQLITSIAEETNLLSLNASIEAARAGEQGRGFAVVAAQIQNLAEQSNESTLRIEEIISSLIRDSEKAVTTMQEVKQIIDAQSTKVAKTEQIFNHVIAGIEHSFTSVNAINDKTTSLDEAKDSIVDAIASLTAVAEENAASSEETSAASSEVSATVSGLSGASVKLKEISDGLSKQINIFKI